MNYKHQIHFLNDVSMWRAHVPALINMNTIKSPFLHQCRFHSNDNDFKVVQKGFIKSSSNHQEAYHLGFTCQQILLLNLLQNSSYNQILQFRNLTPIQQVMLATQFIHLGESRYNHTISNFNISIT